ncbi:hypothetical protein, partial [Nocardia gipuzkoensis]|uniref:hypothetical protein n=1 Tax=Nocardia gipuzkoensis TaxID=2749991 RepID=UPI002453E74B
LIKQKTIPPPTPRRAMTGAGAIPRASLLGGGRERHQVRPPPPASAPELSPVTAYAPLLAAGGV